MNKDNIRKVLRAIDRPNFSFRMDPGVSSKFVHSSIGLGGFYYLTLVARGSLGYIQNSPVTLAQYFRVSEDIADDLVLPLLGKHKDGTVSTCWKEFDLYYDKDERNWMAAHVLTQLLKGQTRLGFWHRAMRELEEVSGKPRGEFKS